MFDTVGGMERSLRAARVATYVYFVLYGTLLGTWVVQIPAIEERVGISHAALGGLLVVLGLGAACPAASRSCSVRPGTPIPPPPGPTSPASPGWAMSACSPGLPSSAG
ncbi:hypothetical protein GCM10010103_56200 [Streptomyces paradoxus]|uniref:Uncharacterized protein n=1 Tax=Streptomyces paradoxus TaxID=66375 RepID=A0A7W9TES4_9ACTN|nr:hypothetical protein [Streptomyces paradoxus]